MRSTRTLSVAAICGVLSLGAVACGSDDEPASTGGGSSSQPSGSADLGSLSGSIQIDGSSTVAPFAEAASELFRGEASNVNVTVGSAGTGDGFERFCRGEIQIADASRPIEDEERTACQEGGVQFSELQVANDGLAIIANPAFPANCITSQQLKRLLGPDSNVTSYSELGGDFPDQPVSFFTPGEESGTFDYFTDEILETDAMQRQDDVQTSADDNQIITGVAGEEGALGYVGFSFAEESADQVKILQLDSGEGCQEPSLETIQSGDYGLSRPIFMYPNDQEVASKPEVRGFLEFVVQNYEQIAEPAGIVPMTPEQAEKSTSKLQQAAS